MILWLILVSTVFVVICNVVILLAAGDQIKSISTLKQEQHKVALVLGTSKWTMLGNENQFFKGRVEASEELYNHGVVKHFLLSGDNSLKEYNEPLLLKKELESKGVPGQSMTMDFAGFRTLDSIIRSKEIFGQDSLVIVTQSFHLPRALFIAEQHNIHAVGYEASGPLPARIWIREVMARTVAVLDILFHRQPKFLGEQEYLPVD